MSYGHGMSEHLYTLQEMAETLTLAFPEESNAGCTRKVRHWTLLDLLEPHEKHTGSGKSRLYAIHELHKAALLMELARWKVPMPIITDHFHLLLADYGESEAWQQAVDQSANVFLSLTWSKFLANVAMQADAPNLTALSLPEDPSMLNDKSSPELGSLHELSSAMVINVTKVFYRLGM